MANEWLVISDDVDSASSILPSGGESEVVKELLRTRALVLSINNRLQSLVEFTSPDGPLAKSQNAAISALTGWNALFHCAAETTREEMTRE